MFVRIPVEDVRTGQVGLWQLDIEDTNGDPLSAVASVDVIPALIALGFQPGDLDRLNCYRSAVIHGVYTDEMLPHEAESNRAIEMPGEIDWSYGLADTVRERILWLHADRATGRIGGPNDGE